MERFKRSMKYQLMESKSFILSFWITIFILNIFFIVLNSMKIFDINIGFSIGIEGNTNTISIAGINIMIILITLLIYNFERNYESFPLSISLSMSRKDYFLSFLADNIFVTLVFATIQGILLKIDPYFVKIIGKTPLYNFLYFNIKTDNLLYIIFILFVLFLVFTSFWNLIASLNYKFGYKIWIVFIGFNILFSIFNIKFLSRIIENLGSLYNSRLSLFHIISLIASTVVIYSLNYFVVSTTNIKKSIN